MNDILGNKVNIGDYIVAPIIFGYHLYNVVTVVQDIDENAGSVYGPQFDLQIEDFHYGGTYKWTSLANAIKIKPDKLPKRVSYIIGRFLYDERLKKEVFSGKV